MNIYMSIMSYRACAILFPSQFKNGTVADVIKQHELACIQIQIQIQHQRNSE